MTDAEMYALARRLTLSELFQLRKVLAAEAVERKGVRRLPL